jgi:uncharacterized protein
VFGGEGKESRETTMRHDLCKKNRIDLHVHIADLDSVGTNSTGFFLWSGRMLARMLKKSLVAQNIDLEGGPTNEVWFTTLEKWVLESQLDRIVLLALDGVYDKSGIYRPEKTRFQVENNFVHSIADRSPCFMFGASIHPYRPDALSALEKAVKYGACLIKWIPSGQHIKPDDPQCIPFFEALAHYNIPLLSHTGVEHVLGSKRSHFNHPERLIPALKMGVTVIAAHCGTRLFLHERSYFSSWSILAREYENFFGDLGAFPVVTRIPYLRKILRQGELREKILYGSDYPAFSSPIWCWQLSFKQMRYLNQIKNPLERNVCVMQALGLPESVFTKANQIFTRE